MQATPALSTCLVLMGCLTLGCSRSNVAPAPPINTATATVPETELSKRESNVVVASQQTASRETDGRRIRVTFQLVEFQDSRAVDAALNGLWKDTASDAKETSGSLESQSRIVAHEEISTMIAGLKPQGLAKCNQPWKKDVLSGHGEKWGTGFVPAGREIAVTATVQADDRVEVSFNANPAAAIGTDQRLVIAGPTTTGTVTEITQVPFLGDIPVIGPMYFSKQIRRKEIHKSLYVVTAEIISE